MPCWQPCLLSQLRVAVVQFVSDCCDLCPALTLHNLSNPSHSCMHGTTSQSRLSTGSALQLISIAIEGLNVVRVVHCAWMGGLHPSTLGSLHAFTPRRLHHFSEQTSSSPFTKQPIVAQDGPGRTGLSRTDTVRDVKNSILSGWFKTRMSSRYWGSIHYGEGAVVAPHLHLH